MLSYAAGAAALEWAATQVLCSIEFVHCGTKAGMWLLQLQLCPSNEGSRLHGSTRPGHTLMNSFWALQMAPHWSLLLVQNSQLTCQMPQPMSAPVTGLQTAECYLTQQCEARSTIHRCQQLCSGSCHPVSTCTATCCRARLIPVCRL